MDEILIDVVDAVRRVQLNRPDKKNAITAAMYDRLATALRTSNDDAGTRGYRSGPARPRAGWCVPMTPGPLRWRGA